MSTFQYKFGTTQGGMELLSNLGVEAPLSGYRPYSTVIRLGDGNLQGHGLPVITWHWGFISVASRAVFLDPLNGALSGPAFIRSRLPDNTFASFETIMNVPTGEENLQSGFILGFDLTFTYCIAL